MAQKISFNPTGVSEWNGSWSAYRNNTIPTYFGKGWGGSDYFITVIKFTTPNKSGIIQLKLAMRAIRGDATSSYDRCRACVSICTSDQYKNNYKSYSPGTDPTRIFTSGTNSSGGFYLSGLTQNEKWYENTYNVKLKGNTTYYLILSPNTSVGGYYCQGDTYSLAIFYEDGTVQIYVDGQWKTAIPYVYNNGWKRAVPYVYNNGWKQCGG